MSSIRAARRYRWRLAGGRLIATETGLCFEPNRLERWRTDTNWQCSKEAVLELRVRGRMWLVIETATTVETFRVFRAAALAPRLQAALQLAAPAPA
jgi:hypothetical protein